MFSFSSQKPFRHLLSLICSIVGVPTALLAFAESRESADFDMPLTIQFSSQFSSANFRNISSSVSEKPVYHLLFSSCPFVRVSAALSAVLERPRLGRAIANSQAQIGTYPPLSQKNVSVICYFCVSHLLGFLLLSAAPDICQFWCADLRCHTSKSSESEHITRIYALPGCNNGQL